MKNRVIYTAVVGDLDGLLQPLVSSPEYDYVCFVRKGCAAGLDGGLWQIRELPLDIPDDRLLARYAKARPELTGDYEWSVWTDGNISIRSESFYDLIDSKIASGVPVSVMKHPRRDCAYDEAYAVLAAGKAGYGELSRIVDFLSREGFPRHAGLFESGIMLRHNILPSVRKMDDLWWECLSALSGRDQLSLVYCARKAGIEIDPLFPSAVNIRDCEYVKYVYHDRTPRRSFFGKKWNGLRQAVSKWLLRRRIARI